MLAIGLAPVLDAVTGWPGFDGTQETVLWIIAPIVWALTLAAALTRLRVDAGGIELRSPVVGTRRIAWPDVASVSDQELVVGRMTVVRGRDGKTVAITNTFSNRAELEAAVLARSGMPKS